MIFGFDPLRSRRSWQRRDSGFLEDLGPEAQSELYYRNRTDGLHPTATAHLARAAVV
jgi:hypothetical protein